MRWILLVLFILITRLHGCNISCDELYVINRTTFCAVFVEYCTTFCAIMVKWGLLGVYCTNNSAVSGKRCTIICAVICTFATNNGSYGKFDK